jgi:hypothetical protein
MNENYSKHTDIICRTPSPDPAAAPSVPAILGASDELRIQEEITRILRDYVDAAYEQTWPVVRGYFVGSNGIGHAMTSIGGGTQYYLESYW